MERFNRTLEAMLSKTVQENQRDWEQQFPMVMFAYSTAIHEATGYIPFYIMYGRSPTDIILGIHWQKKQEVPVYM